MSELAFHPVLKEFFARMYPTVDLDRLRFREGLPFYTLGSPHAMTVGPTIYFAPGKFAPCDREGLALIAHELYHVQQGAAGPGFWFIRLFYVRYALLKALHRGAKGRQHPLEIPAYQRQDASKAAFDAARASSGQAGPFDCENEQPIALNQTFVDAFYDALDAD